MEVIHALLLLIVAMEGLYLVSARRNDRSGSGDCSCKNKKSSHRRLRRKIGDIRFSNCYDFDEPKLMDIRNITLSPDPLIAPGEVHADFTLDVLAPLPQQIEMRVDVHKYMFNLPFRFLCLDVGEDLRLGSCTYRDVCTTLNSSWCDFLQSNSVPCDCASIPPATYRLQKPLGFIIPNKHSMFDVLSKGDYRARVEFVDSRTQKMFGCTQLTWSISKIHKKNKDYLKLFGFRRN